jgi:hypothetical protein
MPLMNLSEYARHRGCEPRAIREAVHTGRITRRSDGLLDSATADIEWENNTDHTQARPGPKHANGHAAAVIELEAPAAGSPRPQSEYMLARTRCSVNDAKLKQLRYEERAGKLCPTEDVRDAARRVVTTLMDACLNLPARLAAGFAVETDAERIYQTLEDELRDIFLRFSEGNLT